MKPSRLGRPLALVAIGIAALILAGCATMSVGSFAERRTDFRQYRTYTWGPVAALATGDPRLDNNPFFHERVQADVERQLAMRGLEKATSAAPDLLLHYHASITQVVDPGGADLKYGDDCMPQVYDVGTLTLDLIDTRTNKLVWRGWAERSIGGAIDVQELMERQIDEAVARIVERLPRTL